jgi:hypothetical protein
MARGRLDDVKAVRRATGATVNDVLLTAVALMLSEFLDDPPEEGGCARTGVGTVRGRARRARVRQVRAGALIVGATGVLDGGHLLRDANER